MNLIAKETVKNIEAYLKNEHRLAYGMLMGERQGGFCRIVTQDRSYHALYIVDANIERLFVDIYPGISIEKAYRQMAHSYINEKTSGFKAGRVDVDDDNGEVRIRVETSIVSNSATIKDISDMEHLAIQISDNLERKLERLGHGVWFKEGDPELMSVAEKKLELLKKKLAQTENKRSSSMPLTEMLQMLTTSSGGTDADDNGENEDEDEDCDHVSEENVVVVADDSTEKKKFASNDEIQTNTLVDDGSTKHTNDVSDEDSS